VSVAGGLLMTRQVIDTATVPAQTVLVNQDSPFEGASHAESFIVASSNLRRAVLADAAVSAGAGLLHLAGADRRRVAARASGVGDRARGGAGHWLALVSQLGCQQ
jgi:hypothetical protein